MASSMAALMHSPAASSNGSTIRNGKTLPDISLGSLGSSFRSDDEEAAAAEQLAQGYGRGGASRAPNLPSITSPDNSDSITPISPPRQPTSALLSLTPPSTVRRASSQNTLPEPGSNAPRRSRVLRKSSTSSMSASSSDTDAALEARYGGLNDDESEILGSEGYARTPFRRLGESLRGSYHGGPSRRNGRHSVAADAMGSGAMTLREQEKELDAVKKDNFNLQLENHFLKERLQNMAPDHIEAALKENVKLKLEILNLSKEMKKLRKLLLQQDRDLAEAQRERGNKGDSRELERMYKEEKERRKRAEAALQRAEDDLANGGGADSENVENLKAQLEDTEASEAVYRQRAEELEDELEGVKASLEDQAEVMEKLRDEADRAQDELERIKSGEMGEGSGRGLNDSIGVGKGREARLQQKLQDMEQDKASLESEISVLRKSLETKETERTDHFNQITILKTQVEKLSTSHADAARSVSRAQQVEAEADMMEDNINELRDRLAAAQLDLDNRDREIDELNNEIEAKMRDHEKEIQQVEAEWRDEVLEARAQVDELKDVLQERDQDIKDLRETLSEREDKIAELEGTLSETHDRLEETLKNIERDNAEKDADLVAANREVEDLGQRIYDLEEALEKLRVREQDLVGELKSADEAFESSQSHYQTLVTALKDKIAKHTSDLSSLRETHDQTRTELDSHRRDVDNLSRQAAEHEQRHRKSSEAKRSLTTERDEAQTKIRRLQADLDSARDRVERKDRDLISVQNALRSIEDETRKIGDEHTSDRFSLELEIERYKRDLERCENELETAGNELDARDEALRQKEIELGTLLDKLRDLETRLSSERQDRLNISNKLDTAQKIASRHEKDAMNLRERIEELEPMLSATQSERLSIQRDNEAHRQERSELLLRVFKDVNKFLGVDDQTTPASFPTFRDTLTTRLRSLGAVRSDFEKRAKAAETSMEQKMAVLKRQIEQKWRALDGFETAVKKLEIAKMQWRSKYSIKEGELEAVKAQNAELSHRLSSAQSGVSTDNSAHLRSLTERAQSAEKRATNATNQLSQLESRLAELQAKSGQAENKWEARVKEYENRLRIAGEKIKTEKQGGKERANQLEAQVRELEKQVELARKRNQRAEGVVATTAHLVSSNQY